MEEFINNPWAINIFGGIISTVVGGVILAAIKGQLSYRYSSTNVSDMLWVLARLILYGIIMVFVTACAIFVYNAVAPLSFMGPFAGILAVGTWLFLAIITFGQIFLGWRFESK